MFVQWEESYEATENERYFFLSSFSFCSFFRGSQTVVGRERMNRTSEWSEAKHLMCEIFQTKTCFSISYVICVFV